MSSLLLIDSTNRRKSHSRAEKRDARKSRIQHMNTTHLLPAARPPTPTVLDQQMARAHLTCWRPASSCSTAQEFLCAWKSFDLVVGELRGGFPGGLLRVAVEEVGDPAGVGETDFPSGLSVLWA